jgi:hypothetical protein
MTSIRALEDVTGTNPALANLGRRISNRYAMVLHSRPSSSILASDSTASHRMPESLSQSFDLAVAKTPVASEHSAVIDQLAADSNWPVTIVEEMYRHEVTQLKKEATIDNYVDVLATRKVRETLRHMPRRPR